jgi:hypothetical protein
LTKISIKLLPPQNTHKTIKKPRDYNNSIIFSGRSLEQECIFAQIIDVVILTTSSTETETANITCA